MLSLILWSSMISVVNPYKILYNNTDELSVKINPACYNAKVLFKEYPKGEISFNCNYYFSGLPI